MQRRPPHGDLRISRLVGDASPGPRESIGVLEVREDGQCRAALAERVEIDGRCHIVLARTAWSSKPTMETKWWSLVLDDDERVFTVRNGSCGDALLAADVPRIVAALESLDLHSPDTMIVVDDASSVLPWSTRARGPR